MRKTSAGENVRHARASNENNARACMYDTYHLHWKCAVCNDITSFRLAYSYAFDQGERKKSGSVCARKKGFFVRTASSADARLRARSNHPCASTEWQGDFTGHIHPSDDWNKKIFHAGLVLFLLYLFSFRFERKGLVTVQKGFFGVCGESSFRELDLVFLYSVRLGLWIWRRRGMQKCFLILVNCHMKHFCV